MATSSQFTMLRNDLIAPTSLDLRKTEKRPYIHSYVNHDGRSREISLPFSLFPPPPHPLRSTTAQKATQTHTKRVSTDVKK
ncbi:hypothetical protein I7I48_05186 [Histoplasma ohiense]|nr:hypothetical protein I7I48_05186 [Histoplasma ohiense (nom. inval.)]